MGFSYDIIGDIAIFEIPKNSTLTESQAADEIMKTHPRVKTVLKKIGEREGKFRLRKMKKVSGNETETIHKENGLRFILDPTKVYFSPREATERLRISEMARPGETVMVMFAGAGPYGMLIAAKNPEISRVYQVEINPHGIEYMKRSIVMNKLGHKITPILGDARKECKRLFGQIDRVLTPLPRKSHEFLDTAIALLKPKGILHFYTIGHHDKGLTNKEADKQLYSEAISRLESECEKASKKLKILDKRKVLPFSPGTWKICIDCKITS